MVSITRGKRREFNVFDTSDGQLQRVYDRLRKRSLRRAEAYEQAMLSWDDDYMDEVFDDRIRFYGLKIQGDVAHAAYVRGVRDALDAIEEG